jgi:predicted acetyltransferase
MDVELVPAERGDLRVVRNLVSFYVYDFSEFMGWACPEDGRFTGCGDLEDYWDRDDQWAFVIRADGELAGFALVRSGEDSEPCDYDMGEFFVLRKFRRKGVGRRAACALFDRFPGRWQVRQLIANGPAVEFWPRVIADYTGGRYDEDEIEDRWGPMTVQRFDSRGGVER